MNYMSNALLSQLTLYLTYALKSALLVNKCFAFLAVKNIHNTFS